MTVAQMEKRLLEISAEFAKTQHPKLRAEYKQIHAQWKQAKR